MTSIDDIISAAQSLSQPEHARLIPMLWDKLILEDWPAPSQAWIKEACRRSDSLDQGKLVIDSWVNVRERARKKAKLDE